MFCTKCGSQIADGSTFCGQCGAPQNVSAPAAAPVAEPVSVAEAAPVMGQAPVLDAFSAVPEEKPAKKEKAPKQGKKKTGLIITIVIVLVLVAAAIGVLVFINSPGFKHDQQIKKADKCMAAEDYAGALAAYEAAYELDKKSTDAEDGIVEAGLELAQQYYDAADYKSALDNYEKVLDIERKNKDAKEGMELSYLALAEQEKTDGDFEKALEYCNEAEEVNDENTVAWETKIDIYYAWADVEAEEGNYDMALSYCDEAYYMGGSYEVYQEKRSDVYLAWGENLLEAGDYEGALDQYWYAQNIDYYNEEVYVKKAEVYLAMGDVNEAISQLEIGINNGASTGELEDKIDDIVSNTSYEVRDSYISGYDHYETSTFTFDANGVIIAESAVNYYTGTVESRCDEHGRVLETVKYDADGNVIYTYTFTEDENGSSRTEEYAYEGGANPVQVWSSLTIYDAATNSQSYILYDRNGDVEEIRNTYYNAGNVYKEEYYESSDLEWTYEYVYDENDVLIQRAYTDRYGNVECEDVTYEDSYDDEGRLIEKVVYVGGDREKAYVYEYRANGSLQFEGVEDSYGWYDSYKYYDIFGNVIEEYDGDGVEEFYNSSWGYNQTIYTLTYEYSYVYDGE